MFIEKKNLLELESGFETVCRYLLTEDISRKEVDDAIEKSAELFFKITDDLLDTSDFIDESDICTSLFDQGDFQILFAKYFYSQTTYNMRRTIQKLVYLLYITFDYYESLGIFFIPDNQNNYSPDVLPSLPTMFYFIFLDCVVRDNKKFDDNMTSLFVNAVNELKISADERYYVFVFFTLGMVELKRSVL
ncbi:hypothetical protein [uncultured Megasphaera sp.]|uniref:hypothetical protein n=1 Tax=uncultured Megasphaera sp. TaxID=165188 RepID=UPI0026060A12|nr:hypothetical protein [uncultured Megasphaera sp.]